MSKNKVEGRKAQQRKIAQERVERLLNLASSKFDKKPELSHRYAELAWKIKLRHNLRLPRHLSLKFCKKCQAFWIPGSTCRVRLHSSPSPYVTITCLRCGYVRRIPYKKKKPKNP